MRFVPTLITALGFGSMCFLEYRHVGPHWLWIIFSGINGGVFGWCLRAVLKEGRA